MTKCNILIVACGVNIVTAAVIDGLANRTSDGETEEGAEPTEEVTANEVVAEAAAAPEVVAEVAPEVAVETVEEAKTEE